MVGTSQYRMLLLKKETHEACNEPYIGPQSLQTYWSLVSNCTQSVLENVNFWWSLVLYLTIITGCNSGLEGLLANYSSSLTLCIITRKDSTFGHNSTVEIYSESPWTAILRSSLQWNQLKGILTGHKCMTLSRLIGYATQRSWSIKKGCVA